MNDIMDPVIPENWKLEGTVLSRTFSFKSHLDALKFVEAVALEAISRELFPELVLAREKAVVRFRWESDAGLSDSAAFAGKIDGFCDCYGIL